MSGSLIRGLLWALAGLTIGCGARSDLLSEQPSSPLEPIDAGVRRDAGIDGGADAGFDAFVPDPPDADLPPPDLEAAIQVSSGLWHSCAATQVGRVHCWGFNNRGQIGDGTGGPARLPVVASGISSARAIATGQSHSCAALEDGTALCWGANESGQLGTGEENLREILPTPVLDARDLVRVSAGGAHTCGLDARGDIYCWGLYDGAGQDRPGTYPRATRVALPEQAAAVAAGLHHSCALLISGDILCWAGHSRGEEPPPLPSGAQLQTVPLPERSVDVGAGDEGSCAVMESGAVYCWGFAEGEPDSPTGATRVFGLHDVAEVTMGHEFSCALLRDRSVRCWGNNERGQLGDGAANGTPGALVTPIGLPPVSAVSAGWRHACALADDGAVWCWGRDWENQLGDGAGGENRLPTVAIVVRD